MSAPGTLERLACGGIVVLAAASGTKRRSFDILLYTGAPVVRWGSRVVFDLAGAEIPSRQVPILFAHDPERPIGFSNEKPTTTADGLRLRGPMLDNEDARYVAEQADQGFKWQASMGIRLIDVRQLAEGESVTVNGSKFEGPGYVVDRWRLLEGSVLSLGADGATSSAVLALRGERALRDTLPHVAARAGATEAAQPTRPAQPTRQATELHREDTSMHERRTPQRFTYAQLEARGSLVDLAEWGPALDVMPRAQVKELLAGEWSKLAADDQSAFGDFDNYAAYRRASAAGRVSIRLGPPAVT